MFIDPLSLILLSTSVIELLQSVSIVTSLRVVATRPPAIAAALQRELKAPHASKFLAVI